MKNFFNKMGTFLAWVFIAGIIIFCLGIFTGIIPITYRPKPEAEVYIVRSCGSQNTIEITKKEEISGIASWYDYKLGDEWYSNTHETAASRSLERESYAKVTNIANGKSVVVRINDYGPAEFTGREIDLSSYAFAQIANLRDGLINVRIEPLDNKTYTNK